MDQGLNRLFDVIKGKTNIRGEDIPSSKDKPLTLKERFYGRRGELSDPPRKAEPVHTHRVSTDTTRTVDESIDEIIED